MLIITEEAYDASLHKLTGDMRKIIGLQVNVI